ncbi:hypothetical protein N0V82_004221 [Gnomoniopsis sp. IMI 355080]|nr:hypothetical protein N0V82_004221 [Gnomoniopsis sp. IMI 355080]
MENDNDKHLYAYLVRSQIVITSLQSTKRPIQSNNLVNVVALDTIVLVGTAEMASNFSLSETVIERGPPSAVLYDLADDDHVTITLPVGSTWSSGLHWHEKHVEYLHIVKGSARVVLGNQVLTISAGDETDEVRVDRNTWHEWRRADTDNGGELVIVERTDPEDGQKAVFFWNLNGVIVKAQHLACPPYMSKLLHDMLLHVWVTLSLFTIFSALDNIPVFINVPAAFSKRGFGFADRTLGDILLRSTDRLVSHLVLFAVSLVAWGLGIRSVRREHTPDSVWGRWTNTTKSKPEAARYDTGRRLMWKSS